MLKPKSGRRYYIKKRKKFIAGIDVSAVRRAAYLALSLRLTVKLL